MADHFASSVVDCEQSLFILQLARRVRERRAPSGEATKREKRKEKKEKRESRALPVSRLQSRACAFLRVLFDGLRKRRDCS